MATNWRVKHRKARRKHIYAQRAGQRQKAERAAWMAEWQHRLDRIGYVGGIGPPGSPRWNEAVSAALSSVGAAAARARQHLRAMLEASCVAVERAAAVARQRRQIALIAGEDLRAGEYVAIGADGLLRNPMRQNNGER